MMELQVDSVLKHYGSKMLLSDIYLHCKKGEIVGLFGRNGSGKSSLLKIIAGNLRAENKFVKVGDLVIKSSWEAKGRINYLPQADLIPNHLKVKTVVNLYCNQPDFSDPIIKDLLDFKVGLLSSGQKRIVELFVVLYSNCHFILLDEPFRGLSPLLVEEFSNRLKLESKNKGIILTDHYYRDVLKLSDRNYILNNGRLRSFKNLDEIKNGIYI